MLLSACVEENVGMEGTDAGYISTNLQSYLEAKKVIDNINIAVTSKRPFYDTTAGEEYIYFFGDDFRR